MLKKNGQTERKNGYSDELEHRGDTYIVPSDHVYGYSGGEGGQDGSKEA